MIIDMDINTRSDYTGDKNNSLLISSSDKEKDFVVLYLLEKLGYPMNMIGTYLYKNMIISVSEYISDISPERDITNYNSLILQLRNHYSQFYFDIARNDLDMGIKTFHGFVSEAISKIDYSKANPVLFKRIFGNSSGDIGYDDQAFILGAYVSGLLNNLKSEKVKVPALKKIYKPENY